MSFRGHTAATQPRGENGKLVPVHGLRNTPTGNSWSAMMSRCFNSNYNVYQNYGARGITVCEFLRRSPRNLIALIGERPDLEHSLDRKDTKGHYSCGDCAECKWRGWPLNVRWATHAEQSQNQTTNVIVEIDGIRRCVSAWAKQYGLRDDLIHRRLERGWTGRDLLKPPNDENNYLTIKGVRRSVQAWAADIGITPEALAKRVKNGWPESQLLLPRQLRGTRC